MTADVAFCLGAYVLLVHLLAIKGLIHWFNGDHIT